MTLCGRVMRPNNWCRIHRYDAIAAARLYLASKQRRYSMGSLCRACIRVVDSET